MKKRWEKEGLYLHNRILENMKMGTDCATSVYLSDLGMVLITL